MKRLGILILVASVFLLANAVALDSGCELSIQKLNQDPYLAVPGDYVKITFQIDGLQAAECGDVTLQLVEKYPISFDSPLDGITALKSGTYVKSFSSHATVAYKVRVDENALDGDNQIEVAYSTKGSNIFSQAKEFNLTVEDVRASFEVYLKNFDSATNQITFEVLNTAKVDVSAVTLELLSSENLKVLGSKTRIIGDLDSNEYTTADFEISSAKVQIPIKIIYTDKTGARRSLQTTVSLDPADFASSTPKSSSAKYWIIAIVVIAIGYWLYRRNKNKVKRN